MLTGKIKGKGDYIHVDTSYISLPCGQKSYKSYFARCTRPMYSVIYYHRSFVEMGLQDETRVRVWLAAISPLPKNQQIFGDPDRP